MATSTQIVIPELKATRLLIPIKGTTSLITHKWSEKAKRQMLEAQQGKKKAKEVRNPEADYESSIYYMADGTYGFPVVAFKAATVRGAKLAGVKMTDARQLFRMVGETAPDGGHDLTPILGEPTMREDMVRVGMGTDLRYRAEFKEWAAILDVRLYEQFLDRVSFLSLINFGGQTVGVGEWRPEKDGVNGTYEIDTDREMQVIEA